VIYSSNEDDKLVFTNCEERSNSTDSFFSAAENKVLSEDNYSVDYNNDHHNNTV